jgi:hypothetical protein
VQPVLEVKVHACGPDLRGDQVSQRRWPERGQKGF